MNRLLQVAKAVKVAITSPPEAAPPGRASPAPSPGRSDFGPRLEELGEGENAWTGVYNGRTYRMFFLVGHPRSGTNWTSAILNLHPAISCTGEFRFESLRRGFDILEANPWHIAHHQPARAVAEKCFQDTVRRIMLVTANRAPAAQWIGDRTPRSLDCYLPGAPHILVVRDPRDVLVSFAHREFKDPGANFSTEPFRTRLAKDRDSFLADPEHFKKHPERLFNADGRTDWFHHLLRIWHGYTVCNQDQLRRLETGELSYPVHVVRYERLHADTDNERARMYRFLGLDPAAAVPIDSNEFARPGFGRTDGQELPAEFYRKGRVGDWKNYFTPAIKAHFKEHAGQLLIDLGYETDHSW